MKKSIILATFLMAGAAILGASESKAETNVNCFNAMTAMWQLGKAGNDVSRFAGVKKDEKAGYVAEFCRSALSMTLLPTPADNFYTNSREELRSRFEAKKGSYSPAQLIEFSKGLNALNDTQENSNENNDVEEINRSVCSALSQDNDVLHFKGLKKAGVNNTLQAEFCNSRIVVRWRWKNFPMPVTFSLSDEELQDRLTDEKLSQAQIRQYGIARSELREAMQPK